MTTTETGHTRRSYNEMSYGILLPEQDLKFRQITSLIINLRKVWKIEFHEGKEAVLYKCANERMQRIEDNLDVSSVIAIGKYIDRTHTNQV